MINKEITEDIIKYVISKAETSLDNLECGFLTGQFVNSLPIKNMKECLNIMHSMTFDYAKVVSNIVEGVLADSDCVFMFQYIFDRSFEISYKLIIGKEPDTEFRPAETGGYYELDVPQYIQLKVNKIIPKICLIFKSSYEYINDKGYINGDCLSWLFPLLSGACGIAFKFAMEMDLNDDSEMRQYLKND